MELQQIIIIVHVLIALAIIGLVLIQTIFCIIIARKVGVDSEEQKIKLN